MIKLYIPLSTNVAYSQKIIDMVFCNHCEMALTSFLYVNTLVNLIPVIWWDSLLHKVEIA